MTAPVDVEFVPGTIITSEWLNGVNDKVQTLKQPEDFSSFSVYDSSVGTGKGLFTDWNVVPGETVAGKFTYQRGRVLVGDATKYDGTHWHNSIPATIQPDGTMNGGVAGASFVTNRFKGSFQYLEAYTSLSSYSARGWIGGSFATQSSDNTSNGASIGVSSLAFNNNASTTQGCWSFYGVAIRDVNATSGVGAIAAELHVSNMINDAPQWDGYATTPVGLTSVLHLAQGGEHTQASQGNLTDYNVTSAINITRFKGTNGGAFLKGIIFHKESLAGCDGSTGTGIALDMAKGHQIQWRFGAGDANISSVIRCDAASHQTAPRIIFGSSAFSIKQLDTTETEVTTFQVLLPTLAAGESVNGLFINCQKTGAGFVGIQALGPDTNIDLYLAPKGTSGLIKTSYSTSAANTPASFSATRRLAFKDSSGTIYYIPCSSTAW